MQKSRPAHERTGQLSAYFMRAAGSVSLALDPDLGAKEGVGGTQAQALVGGGKHTQTMVVGVPKAINGNGLKVDAILGNVQVKATLCRPQIVQQLDRTGHVPHRDVLKDKVVRELDGLSQGIGVAGAVGVHRCQGLHQSLQVVPLVLPLGGGPLQQVAVDELTQALQQAAGIVGAHIQLAVVDLHAPDVLVLVAAKAGLQAGEAAVGEHLGGVAHHQLHILVLVHAVQVHGLVQVGVEEPAIQAAAKLAVGVFTGLGEQDPLQSDLLVVVLADVQVVVKHHQVGCAGTGALRVDAKGVPGTVLFLVTSHRGPGKGAVGISVATHQCKGLHGVFVGHIVQGAGADGNIQAVVVLHHIPDAAAILNLAEAAVELSTYGVNDYLAVAQVAFDQLRSIHGGLPAKTMDLEVVRHERRIDLMYEGFRYWDLKRWRIGEEKMHNKTLKALYPILHIDETTSPASVYYTLEKVEAPDLATRVKWFEERDYYCPLPLSKSPGIVQNDGWN